MIVILAMQDFFNKFTNVDFDNFMMIAYI